MSAPGLVPTAIDHVNGVQYQVVQLMLAADGTQCRQIMPDAKITQPDDFAQWRRYFAPKGQRMVAFWEEEAMFGTVRFLTEHRYQSSWDTVGQIYLIPAVGVPTTDMFVPAGAHLLLADLNYERGLRGYLQVSRRHYVPLNESHQILWETAQAGA